MFGDAYDDHAGVCARALGYSWEGAYLDAFGSPEGRADMADRFVRKANELGLAITVYYE